MRLEFVRRPAPSRLMRAITPLFALIVAMIVGGLTVAALSYEAPEISERVAGVCEGGVYPSPATIDACRFERARAAEELLTHCRFRVDFDSGAVSGSCAFPGEKSVAGFFAFGESAVEEIFIKPVLNPLIWPDLLAKAAPLVLIATGLAIGFRANVWNIGAEGQYVVGALAGTGVALASWGMDGVWILPLMCLAGAAAGALYAALPALLRTRLSVSEILTSLMLTYVAAELLKYLLNGPWKDPDGYSFPETRFFDAARTLPKLDEGGLIHLGAPIALLAALIAWLIMARSVFGFGVRASGLAPRAARYGGFRADRTIWATLLLSGALAGLAGVFQVSGATGQLTLSFATGYGFTAIIVAFLGRLHPIGVVLAGLVLAVTYIGGDEAQSALGLPDAAASVFQAMTLFFLLAADVLVRYRLRIIRRGAATRIGDAA